MDGLMKKKATFFKTYNRRVSPQEVLNRAHRVKTMRGETLINHMNGFFFSVDGRKKLSLTEIYPFIRKAYSTNRREFAERKDVSKPLMAGVVLHKNHKRV